MVSRMNSFFGILRVFVAVNLILLAMPWALPAIQELPVDPEGDRLLSAAEAAIFTGPVGDNEDEVLDLLERARRHFTTLSDSTAEAYWMARAALLEGMLYNQQERERQAVRILEEGLELSDRALSEGPFSEGLRVRSDLHSQMMFAKGLFYMIRNGDDARDSALTALEREPANVRAHISTAGYFLNAPPVAGGDPDEAERLIRRALTLSPTRNERFVLEVLLAQTLEALDSPGNARNALDRAEAIFPGSPWLEEVREELGAD